MLKLLVVGDSGVGKTSLINRYVYQTCPFSKYSSTTKMEKYIKFETHFNDHRFPNATAQIDLEIYDTPSEIPSLLPDFDAVILISDFRPESIDRLSCHWTPLLDKLMSPKQSRFLIANKTDLVNPQFSGQVKEYCCKRKIFMSTCSAKNNIGVYDAFQKIISQIVQDNEHQLKIKYTPKQNLNDHVDVIDILGTLIYLPIIILYRIRRG